MAENMFDLTGKVAIVTGSSRGLGQYMARALARAGADVAVTSRSLASLDEVTREIREIGREAFPHELDVRSYDSVQAMVEDTHRHFGKIDILVNNAGCNVRKPAVEVTPEEWNMILETNLRGPFFMAQAVAKNDPAPLRPDHQHRFGDVACSPTRPGPLLREPRRGQATHDEPGRRLGDLRDHRQLSGARLVQDATDRGPLRGPGPGSNTSPTGSR